MGIGFSNDIELVNIILTCIADNQRYLVKDPEITNLVYSLVWAKIKTEPRILTSNMLHFLALKLLNLNQTLMVNIGNYSFNRQFPAVSYSNIWRLNDRLCNSYTRINFVCGFNVNNNLYFDSRLYYSLFQLL